MMKRWRPLALAAALNVTGAIGVVSAQTVVVRNAPAQATVEVVLNTTTVDSTTANVDGFATVHVPVANQVKGDMDAYIHVDACDTLRRVLIAERGVQPPEPGPGCDRKQIAGLFLIRRVTTLVVDVGGLNPTVLLRQGPVSFRPPRGWSPSPTGFVIFGGGGLANFRDPVAIFCGNVTECSGDASGVAYTIGAGYWFTRYLAAEASYLKPSEATVSGNGGNYRFNSSLDAHVVTATGKAGVPIGPVRLYGHGGASYHRATSATTQTFDATETQPASTQTLELKTSGWGWLFGGGGEVWLARSFALYGEAGFTVLKGGNVDEGEGSLDDRLISLLFGARVRIGR